MNARSEKQSILTAAQVTQLRRRLEARYEALKQELGSSLAGGGLPNRHGDADDTIADLESEIDMAGVERDNAELVQVVQALDRLAGARAGRCIDCGEAIAWARLEAQPQASRCLACASKGERASPSPPRL